MAGVVAGKIGNDEFSMFELEPADKSTVIETLKRPGVDYRAYKEMGLDYPEQNLIVQQEFSSHNNALAARSTYNAYVGKNKVLIRGGVTYGTFKFLRSEDGQYPQISPPRRSPVFVGSPTGSTSGWIVRSVHRVQRQS